MPASGRRNSLVDLTRTPGAFLVFVDRSAGLQHGIDDSPRLFHIVLAGEQCGVSRHCVAQHAFVRVHLVWTGMAAGHHFYRLAFQHLARSHDSRAYGYRHLGADPEPQMVPEQIALPDDRWRFSKPAENLRAGYRQVLPCADIEWHPFPTPGIDLQSQRGKGLHLRIGPDSFFLAVAAKLPSDEIVRFQRWNRLQYLHLLITNGFTVYADWGLHRKIAQDLEEMVL